MNERARESSVKDYLIAVSYSILIMTGRVGGRQPFAYSVPFEIVDFLEAFVVCLRRQERCNSTKKNGCDFILH